MPKIKEIITAIIGLAIYELGLKLNFSYYLILASVFIYILLVVYFPIVKKRLDRNKSKTLQSDLQKYGLHISQDEIKKIAQKLTGKTQILNSDYVHIKAQEIMVEKKLGLTIDWKWTPSDILFGIKDILPKFYFAVEKESEPLEKKIFFKGKVLGDEMEFFTPNDKPNEFIKRIEPKIKELTDKRFEELETEGDYYCFILVPK